MKKVESAMGVFEGLEIKSGREIFKGSLIEHQGSDRCSILEGEQGFFSTSEDDGGDGTQNII